MADGIPARVRLKDARDAGQTVTISRALARRILATLSFTSGCLEEVIVGGEPDDDVIRVLSFHRAAADVYGTMLAEAAGVADDEDLDD